MGDGRGEYDAVIVRTDYTDVTGWQGVLAVLAAGDTATANQEDRVEWSYTIVEDPSWAGAAVDDVVEAAAADEYLSVVFIADKLAMAGPEHLLLAVSLDGPEDDEETDDDRETNEFGRSFRILPGHLPSVHANLDIGNMGFEEFAAVARRDPEGAFRGFDA